MCCRVQQQDSPRPPLRVTQAQCRRVRSGTTIATMWVGSSNHVGNHSHQIPASVVLPSFYTRSHIHTLPGQNSHHEHSFGTENKYVGVHFFFFCKILVAYISAKLLASLLVERMWEDEKKKTPLNNLADLFRFDPRRHRPSSRVLTE